VKNKDMGKRENNVNIGGKDKEMSGKRKEERERE